MCSLHLTHPSAHTPGAVGGSAVGGSSGEHLGVRPGSSWGFVRGAVGGSSGEQLGVRPGSIWGFVRGAVGGSSGEQLGVQCLAQGSHLSRGQFLPEPRFKPTTSGYKSNALSTRPRLPLNLLVIYW